MATEQPGVRRLNWGCGSSPTPGWLNADLRPGPGVDLVGDIRQGLGLPAASLDYIVSVHALQEIPVLEVVGALAELRRVLRPGGVLRLCLPDMDAAIAAYQRGDAAYFFVPDEDAETVAGKMVVQLTWYGASRMMFTWDYARELLQKAGFANIRQCRFKETSSCFPDITDLDNRERETLFVEASNPGGAPAMSLEGP